MPRNVVIKNNKFLHNSSGEINVFTSGPEGTVANTILGVEVSNNFFFESQSRPINYKSVGDSKITNNFIYNFNKSLNSVIYVQVSEGVEISQNYIKGEISKADFAGVKIDTETTEDITTKTNIEDVEKAS